MNRFTKTKRFSLWLFFSVTLVSVGGGCSDDDTKPAISDAGLDGGAPDGARLDGGDLDGALEVDGNAGDGGTEIDAGTPLPGWGDISGACAVLDDEEWNASEPFIFRNAIDLGTSGFDENLLTPGGLEIWEDGNLGGSSIHSEIIAYELLHRCELAGLLKTEGEILYQNDGGKKTDILVDLDTRKVGVSVTRAFHFPPTDPYTETEAADLLSDKLNDVLLSAQNADPADAWQHSVLHVVAYDHQYADVVEAAFADLDPAVKADTIVFVTVTDGQDDFVY
jgi:hypothetical protein